MAAIPMYPLSEARGILRQWREWVASTPDEVTSTAVAWTIPVDPHMPEPAHGQPVLITAGIYAGSVEEGERALQPLREFGTPLADISSPMPFRIVQSAFDPFFPNTGELRAYWKSLYLNELRDEVIDIIADGAENRTSPLTLVNIPYMGGAVRRVGAEETAFGDRSAPFMVSTDANWRDPSEDETHIAWARGLWDRLQPHSTGAVYLNFLGREDDGVDALIKAAFGSNCDRLARIKAKHDPMNLFRLNQNIPPAS